METNKEIKTSTIVMAVLGGLLLIMAALAVLIYGFDSENKLVRKAEQMIPFPIAIIDQTRWISAGEFHENVRSIRRFYENQDFSKLGIRVDFTTQDGQKRLKIKERQLLTKMIEDESIRLLAEKEGIRISEQDLKNSVDKKLEELGNETAVKEQLLRLYGWTIDDFKESVVKPSLYREKLEGIFETKHQDSETAKKKIEAAEDEIKKRGKSFSDIVAEFSDGSSSQSGGELGWFKKSQIVPEIADQIFKMKAGEQSAVLESPLGFHIIEMQERKKDGEAELVRIRQIFVAKKTFADWVKEEMQKTSISVLLKGTRWNSEKAQVDFDSEELQNFEQQLMADPKGDISVMF